MASPVPRAITPTGRDLIPRSSWYSLWRLNKAAACCLGDVMGRRKGRLECSASTQQMLGELGTEVPVRQRPRI